MLREEEKIDYEEPSILEGDLYEKVETFFTEEKECDKVGSVSSLPMSLSAFGGTIYPDVFGVKNPESEDFLIYMGEGKLSFRGRNFDICKGQAITLQRFADYVYVFFPRSSWNEIGEDEKSDVLSECENLRLGLLIVDKGLSEEKVKPQPNTSLLKQDNREYVRDEIAHYFPDFTGPEENKRFFEAHVKLADNITKKSCRLIDILAGSFVKFTPVKKQSIKTWHAGDTFEFYYSAELPERYSEVFLVMRPFGDFEIFNISSPTLLVQHRLKSSILRDKSARRKLGEYIGTCLERKCRVETFDMIFFDPDVSDDVLSNIEETKPDKFSIFKKIDILGVEEEEIRGDVEKALQEIVDFSKSLK